MIKKQIYLDYNASAPLKKCAKIAMENTMKYTGNPSSVHASGRQMRAIIEQARQNVAQCVNAESGGVVFTSGATEAIKLAMEGAMPKNAPIYALTSEHPCVLNSTKKIVKVPIINDGTIDKEKFEKLLNAHDHTQHRFCLAMQMANNESGVIQPVAEIAKKVKEKNGWIICDTVQAIGKIKVDVKKLGVDMIVISAHKIGGPQGVGALVLADVDREIIPMLTGGGQEMNRRAGTENTMAIAGFGAVANEIEKEIEKTKNMENKRNEIEKKIYNHLKKNVQEKLLYIFGKNTPRLCNTLLFAIKGVEAQAAIIALDLEGIAVSSGAACSVGKVENSHVLKAMGVQDDINKCAIRVSIGAETTNQHINKFCNAIKDIVERMQIQQNNDNNNQRMSA